MANKVCYATYIYLPAQHDILTKHTSATSLCWFHLTAFSSLGREEGIFSSRCILLAGGGGYTTVAINNHRLHSSSDYTIYIV